MSRLSIFISFGVLVIGCVGEDPAIIRAQFNTLQKQANQLESDFKREEAVAKYEQAVSLVQIIEGYEAAIADLNVRIKTLREEIRRLKEVEEVFRGYEAKFNNEDIPQSELKELRRKVRDLQKMIEKTHVPFEKDVDALLKRIDNNLENVCWLRSISPLGVENDL